jgi:hypothetical protein
LTTALPFDNTESIATLRKRWWDRYFAVQSKTDTKLRTALIAASSDAQDRINALGENSTFSAGVRTAQIRLAMNEVKIVLKDLFGQEQKIIKDGQGDEAQAAIDGLTDTDRDFLVAAFRDKGANAIPGYIASQKHSAVLGVAHAISSVTKSNYSLSSNVYRSQTLANNWVKRDVTSGILRGDSAKQIAATVRKHILPNTPGGVSYAAMRLARSELNNAFHATAITASQDRPWVTGMRWYVSSIHVDDPKEICTQLKGQLFPVSSVPPKPHPQCRCFVAPEIESLDVFTRHLTAGQYRDWMTKNAA